MLFADGILLDGPYILLVFAGAGGVIALLFRLLISSKDKEFALIEAQLKGQLAEMEGLKKAYQGIAQEAVKSAVDVTNYYRNRYEGKSPVILPLPVVAEGNSPSTGKQLEAATVATMRASMAAIKLATGQEARKESDHDAPPIS